MAFKWVPVAPATYPTSPITERNNEIKASADKEPINDIACPPNLRVRKPVIFSQPLADRAPLKNPNVFSKPKWFAIG
jgi:hypothetical protein